MRCRRIVIADYTKVVTDSTAYAEAAHAVASRERGGSGDRGLDSPVFAARRFDR